MLGIAEEWIKSKVSECGSKDRCSRGWSKKGNFG